jgi:hypothetical protein
VWDISIANAVDNIRSTTPDFKYLNIRFESVCCFPFSVSFSFFSIKQIIYFYLILNIDLQLVYTRRVFLTSTDVFSMAVTILSTAKPHV